MKIKYVIPIFVSSFFIFTSCVASKNIIKTASLCGLVVDEHNVPIPDFKIFCYENAAYKESAITNESGIFVFPDVDIGSYFIEGEKQNYTNIEKRIYDFNNCSDLLCIQVKSLKECIENIRDFIEVDEFKKGVLLLHSIVVEKGSFCETVCLCYEAYLNYRLGNKDCYTDCIRKLKKIKNDKCKEFVSKLEAFYYE